MSPCLFLWTDVELRNFSSTIPAESAVSALALKYDDPWLLLLIFCTPIRLKTFLLCTFPLHNGSWELKCMNLQKLDNFWFHKTRRTKSGLKLEFLCKNKPQIHKKYFSTESWLSKTFVTSFVNFSHSAVAWLPGWGVIVIVIMLLDGVTDLWLVMSYVRWWSLLLHCSLAQHDTGCVT